MSLREIAGHQFTPLSAGLNPLVNVHSLAIEVMAERGIDIGQQQPKGVEEYLGRELIPYLVVVCKRANGSCPRIFPGVAKRMLWPFGGGTAIRCFPNAGSLNEPSLRWLAARHSENYEKKPISAKAPDLIFTIFAVSKRSNTQKTGIPLHALISQ
jgi:hypothetical protein